MEVGRSIFRAIADFSSIRREARSTERSLDGMARTSGAAGNRAGRRFTAGFIKGIAILSIIGPIIAALGGIGAAAFASVGSVVQLGASLLTLGGLAVPATAALFGFAAAGAALGMGLSTMKKRLADLAPAFTAMKESVGRNFMYFAEKPIRNMVRKLLPELRDGLENIGSSWGKVAADTSNSLTKHLGGGVLGGMLEKTRQMVENTRPGIDAMVLGFTKLGIVGSQYLPALGTWIGNMGIKFGTFLNTAQQDGSLKRWADAGIQGLKDLWTVVKGVAGIFGALNKAANASGATTTLGGLAAAMTKISSVMNAPVFQGALTEIFRGANAGAAGLLKSLDPIGEAFVRGAPALSEFFRLGGEILGLFVGNLATALSDPTFGAGLVSFLEHVKAGAEKAGPLLPTLAASLGRLLDALGPLVEALGPGVTNSMSIMSLAIAAITEALSPLLTAIASSPPLLIAIGGAWLIWKAAMMGMAFYEAVTGIMAILGPLGAKLALLWANVTAWIALKVAQAQTMAMNAASWVAGIVAAIGRKIASLALAAAAWVAQKAAIVGAMAVSAASWVAGIIVSLGQKIASLALAAAAWVAQKAAIVGAMAVSAASWVAGIVASLARQTAALAVNAAAWLWQKIQVAGAMAVSAGAALWGAIAALGAQTAALVVNAASWVAQKAIMVAGAVATGIATAAQWALNAAMAANPITLIIIAIVLLIAALVWFFTQTELGQQIWAAVWGFITSTIQGFLDWWTGTFWPGVMAVFAALGAGLSAFMAVWNQIWTNVWNFLVSVFSAIFAFVASIPGTIIGFLSQLGALAALAFEWFMGMLRSAMDVGGQMLSWVAGLPGQVLSFLGDLGGLLVGAGQALIQGFINGIQGMIGAVQGAVGGIMDLVGSFFPHSPAKQGEFSGKGWTPYRGKALMDGFTDGITAGTKSGELAAANATLAISNQLHPTISPLNALGGLPAASMAPEMAAYGAPKMNPNAETSGGGGLSVTVNNPIPEAPSQSIQKTYQKIAYLGLDARETVGV